jgi:hypothetical protein
MDWLSVMRQTNGISRIRNPVRRNRAINEAYVEVFFTTFAKFPIPTMRWAGAAAFASKQVGCVLRGLLTSLGRRPFARGNRAVFEDIYPSIKFYTDFYHPALHDLFLAVLRRQSVAPRIIRAMQSLSPTSAPLGLTPEGRERLAARRILQHEQFKNVQTIVFDNRWLRGLLGLHRLMNRLAPISRIEVVFAAGCRSVDDRFVVPFLGVRIDDLHERWNYSKRVVERFDELDSDPSTRWRLYTAMFFIYGGHR